MHILRVADVPRLRAAGMSGYMLSSGDAIESAGHSVEYWFADDLWPALGSPQLRRLVIPLFVAAKIVKSRLLKKRIDVVEIHEPLAAAYGLLSRLFTGRLPPLVVLSHGLEVRHWRAYREQMQGTGRNVSFFSRISVPTTLLAQSWLGLKTAAAVMVVSSVDRRFLTEDYSLSPDRVFTAFPGVDKPFFDRPLPARGEHLRAIFVGSWIERKGTETLAAAWTRLIEDDPRAELTIVGSGADADSLAELRKHNGVTVIPQVTRAELPELLHQHNLFVLPSWFEGLPLSLLEAAAAGMACVVCDVCGNLDVFPPAAPEASGGMLMRPGDVDALHHALLRASRDLAELSQMGARARNRARMFSWAKNADDSLLAYSAARRFAGAH